MALKSFKTYLKEDYIPNHRHELNENIIDRIQTGADVLSGVLSFIPGANLIGSGIDALSAGVDLAQGQYGDAALRGAAAALGVIPGVGAAAKVGAGAIRGAKVLSVAGRARGAASGAVNIGKAAKETMALGGKLAGKIKDLKSMRQARAAAKEVAQAKTVTKDLLSKGIKDPSAIARAVETKVGTGALKRTVMSGRVGPGRLSASEITKLTGRETAEQAAKRIDTKLLARGIDPSAVASAATSVAKNAGTGVLGATRGRAAALAGKIRTVTSSPRVSTGPIRALRQTGVAMTRQGLRSQAAEPDTTTASSGRSQGPIDRAQVDYLQVRRAGQ
jgi:hypothetical protein